MVAYMKNVFYGLLRRLNKTDGRVSKFEVSAIETIQIETQRESEEAKSRTERPRAVGQIKLSNIHVIGASEEGENGQKNYWKR